MEHTNISSGATIFTWTPPTTNADGTLLTDLDSYRIYCGSSTNNYSTSMSVGLPPTNVLGEVEYPINWVLNVDRTATYYCALTATDTNSNESAYSNEVVVPLVGMAPAAPGVFKTK